MNLTRFSKRSTAGLRFRCKEPLMKKALEKNRLLKGVYKGKRCFILGTGPSIKNQDLSSITDETCLLLNSFYLHSEYLKFKDIYHVITGFYLHPNSLESHDYVLSNLNEKLKFQRKSNRRFFVNYQDKKLIDKYLSNPDNRNFYTYFIRNIEDIHIYGIDASLPLYSYHSVSVMALQLAIHMGFDEIYLLGLDHDWIVRYAEQASYYHFYESEDVINDNWGQGSNINWGDEFYAHYQLWKQYRLIRSFCMKNNILVCNCTEGGLLDVFPRVRLNSITIPKPVRYD
jgi:hypothetical protein